jgi:hypothetical protein
MGRIKSMYLKDENNMPVVWTLKKLIESLRLRYKDLDEEVRVYERMTGATLDTNELMKIINLSYLDEDDDEIDIDSNINLQDALRLN